MKPSILLLICALHYAQYVTSETTLPPITPSTSRDDCEASESFLDRMKATLVKMRAGLKRHILCGATSAQADDSCYATSEIQPGPSRELLQPAPIPDINEVGAEEQAVLHRIGGVDNPPEGTGAAAAVADEWDRRDQEFRRQFEQINNEIEGRLDILRETLQRAQDARDASVTIPPSLTTEEMTILENIQRINRNRRRVEHNLRRSWARYRQEGPTHFRINGPNPQPGDFFPEEISEAVVPELPSLEQQPSETIQQYISRLKEEARFIQREIRNAQTQLNHFRQYRRLVPCAPEVEGAMLRDGRYCRGEWYFDLNDDQENYANVRIVLRILLTERHSMIDQLTGRIGASSSRRD